MQLLKEKIGEVFWVFSKDSWFGGLPPHCEFSRPSINQPTSNFSTSFSHLQGGWSMIWTEILNIMNVTPISSYKTSKIMKMNKNGFTKLVILFVTIMTIWVFTQPISKRFWNSGALTRSSNSRCNSSDQNTENLYYVKELYESAFTARTNTSSWMGACHDESSTKKSHVSPTIVRSFFRRLKEEHFNTMAVLFFS